VVCGKVVAYLYVRSRVSWCMWRTYCWDEKEGEKEGDGVCVEYLEAIHGNEWYGILTVGIWDVNIGRGSK
jgi:hypothetical protein